jgi:hypothetical protein
MADVDAAGIGALGAGIILAYAGIKGISVSAALASVIRGHSPGLLPDVNPIGGTPAAAPSSANEAAAPIVAGGASGQQALQNAAAAYGWGTGAQWQALQAVEMAEAGFNASATNPCSGAFGMAQALGHGTSGTACPSTGVNQYSGYGLSASEAQQANCGDATAQAVWMCQYIAATYGNPVAAWAHEQANHWY